MQQIAAAMAPELKAAIEAAPGVSASDFRLVMVFDS